MRHISRARDSLALSGLAVAMTWRDPAVAHASPWEKTGDGGVFIGLRFGNPRRPIAAPIGLEVRGVLLDNAFTCDAHMQDYALHGSDGDCRHKFRQRSA